MCAIGSRAALVVLLTATVCPAADAPAIHQATPNFSNAIAGPNFQVSWSANPLELAPDDLLILSIRFTGVTNPDRVRRPDLANHPAFKAAFREILDGRDVPPSEGETNVVFSYRLRLRDDAVKAIPELAVGYYSPGNDRVATRYLDEIPLTVKANARPSLRIPDAPDRFFALPDLAASSSPPSVLEWLGLVVTLVVAPAAWIVIWRRRHPDGVRLAILRRNRAVRTALDGLDRAERSPEPVAAALRVFHNYLVARYGAAVATPTPGDIAGALADVELPEERIAEAVQLVRDCDAWRFGGGEVECSVSRVRSLILAWEEQK